MRVSPHLFPVCWAIALASCAAPKAVIVAEENGAKPAPVSQKPAAPSEAQVPVPEEPALPGSQNDGIRVPDVLGLPSESEFRPTNPTAPKTGADPGAVISRPPLDPPSRPKPKEKPAE